MEHNCENVFDEVNFIYKKYQIRSSDNSFLFNQLKKKVFFIRSIDKYY